MLLPYPSQKSYQNVLITYINNEILLYFASVSKIMVTSNYSGSYIVLINQSKHVPFT